MTSALWKIEYNDIHLLRIANLFTSTEPIWIYLPCVQGISCLEHFEVIDCRVLRPSDAKIYASNNEIYSISSYDNTLNWVLRVVCITFSHGF